MIVEYVTDEEVRGAPSRRTRKLVFATEFVDGNPDWFGQVNRSLRVILPGVSVSVPRDTTSTCIITRGEQLSSEAWDGITAEDLSDNFESLPETAFITVKASLTMAFMLDVALRHDVYGTDVGEIDGVLGVHHTARGDFYGHYSDNRVLVLYAPGLEANKPELSEDLAIAFMFAHMP